MTDINNGKRDDNKTGEAERNNVGVVPGDTYASALDPYGSAAGVDAGGAQFSKEWKGSEDEGNHGSKTRD